MQSMFIMDGKSPSNIPSSCQAGKSFKFTLSHIVSGPKGGLRIMYHKWGSWHHFFSTVQSIRPKVIIEPQIQPLTGEQVLMRNANSDPNGRLDLPANGVWGGCLGRAHNDVRVFNPFQDWTPRQLFELYHYHQNEKKSKYEQHILEVEHASSITPLTLSSTGGIYDQHYFSFLFLKTGWKNI